MKPASRDWRQLPRTVQTMSRRSAPDATHNGLVRLNAMASASMVSSGASQSSAAAITARVVAATDLELGGSVPKVRLLVAITAGVAAELATMILRRAPDCCAAYLV